MKGFKEKRTLISSEIKEKSDQFVGEFLSLNSWMAVARVGSERSRLSSATRAEDSNCNTRKKKKV